MDFMISLLLLVDWKDDSYDIILVVVDYLIKMVYYELDKTTIEVPKLVKVIINMVVRHSGLPELIINDQSSLLTSKF